MRIRLGDLKRLLREGEELPEEESDSLDQQVDRYLAQYEGQAKATKNEGLDFRSMTRRFLREVEGDEEESADEKEKEVSSPEAPPKLTMEDIDVHSFANDVVRLVDNYDSLLEVQNTLVRRAINFVAKAYEPDVVEALRDALRNEHGLVPGKSRDDVHTDEFQAPLSDRGGPDLTGGA